MALRFKECYKNEVRVKRKQFKRFHDNRKSILRRFLTSIRNNDYKTSRLISFLEFTSVQGRYLTAVLVAVPFSGSMQDDARCFNPV